MPGGSPQSFAHSLRGRPEEEWQTLEDHLNATADHAESFAWSFAPGFGRLAGLWHDAGKYQRAFQDYIRKDPDAHVSLRVDHSTVGALIAVERKSPLIGFAIAGHHGGIPNARDLPGRLLEKKALLPQARMDGLPAWIEEQIVAPPPHWLQADRILFSLWTRFIFSALVDADFLDTGRFYAGGKARETTVRPTLQELSVSLDSYLERKSSEADRTDVNEMRSRVRLACRTAATLSPGSFTLTVPTAPRAGRVSLSGGNAAKRRRSSPASAVTQNQPSIARSR